MGPEKLVHADHAGPFEPGGFVDQQLLAGGQDRIVGRVSADRESGGGPCDGQAIDDHTLERAQRCVPREHGAEHGRARRVLAPHAAAVRRPIPTHSELQHRRSPAQQDKHETRNNGALGNALLAALVAPVIELEDTALQHPSIRLDPLPGHGPAQPVELAESIEIGRGQGNVEHVKGFRMVSGATSIFGRPRRRHRSDATTPSSATSHVSLSKLYINARDHLWGFFAQ